MECLLLCGRLRHLGAKRKSLFHEVMELHLTISSRIVASLELQRCLAALGIYFSTLILGMVARAGAVDGVGEKGDTHGVVNGDGEMGETCGGGTDDVADESASRDLPEVSYEGLGDLVWPMEVAGEECGAPGR